MSVDKTFYLFGNDYVVKSIAVCTRRQPPPEGSQSHLADERLADPLDFRQVVTVRNQ